MVTPLHKSGSLSHSGPNNFRPVSKLPVVIKISEHAVHKQVYGHLTTHNLLSPNQTGFRPGHFTSSALLDVHDYFFKNIDKGNTTGTVFLDLSKAFDLISHLILKKKLAKVGIRGTALDWFDNYLQNRF